MHYNQRQAGPNYCHSTTKQRIDGLIRRRLLFLQLVPMIEAKQIRIQMIFPKQQMKIEQRGTPELKKQALSLIIELYLNRKKDEDISFLNTNFGSTRELAIGIKSSLDAGLDDEMIETNRIAYGQNEKKLPSKCLSVRDYIKSETLNLFFIVSNVLLVSCLILGIVRKSNDLASSSAILLIANFALACLRVLLSCYCSFHLEKTSQQKTKNNLYQVVRSGHLIQIEESEIVVGDIVQLGFREKAPATGLMLGTNDIFVKENQNCESTQLKSSLESCLKQIQKMSILELKLSFENATLPSPIVLRGSQLVKGNTYSIMVISVTQQNLLKDHGLHTQGKFSNKNYDLWVATLTKKWTTCSIIIIASIFIALSLTKTAQFRLYSSNSKQSVDMFFELLHQISVFCLILNVAPIASYLNLIFMKLMINLKTIENFVKFFTLKRILCNEREIIQHDQINIKQLAVCDKHDLISLEEIRNLDFTTAKIIYQVQKTFRLKIDHGDPRGKPSKIYDRIVHVKKKNIRIISVVSTLKKQIVFDQVMKQITKINDGSNYSRSIEYKGTFLGSTKKQIQKEKQKCGSFNFLKIPFRTQGEENLKEIIHSKCRIKSRSVLDSLAGLAENGLRTYYFQILDLKSLQDITHIISKGRLIPFTSEQKQKIVVLSRKMTLVYGLTPIMIAYNEGTYVSQPAQFLVCVFGANISESNQVISKLNYLPSLGIKSLIFINDFNENTTNEQKERQIIRQYTNRNWIQSGEGKRICSAGTITEMLNRLVCRKCWIANCDCRQKIEQASNIQPFIQLSERLKIVYNTTQSDLQYLESAYRQLDNNLICLDGQNVSIVNTLDSIMVCLRFVEDLRKSVILFYAIAFICLFVPIISWLRGFEIISPNQMGFIFVMLTLCCSLAFMCERRTSPEAWESTNKTDDRIKITNRELFIKVFTIAILVIIISQLMRTLSFLIPEYADSYDSIISTHGLDPHLCKYDTHGSMTPIFNKSQCSVHSADFQFSQFSRLSTLTSLYVFCSLWVIIVVVNRNLLSVWSIFTYTSAIGVFVVLIEKLPWVMQTYSSGLAWQHYIIGYALALLTVVIGWVLGHLISKIPAAEYFDDETQIYIDLDGEPGLKNSQKSYIHKLKYYQRVKKDDNDHKQIKNRNLLSCLK